MTFFTVLVFSILLCFCSSKNQINNSVSVNDWVVSQETIETTHKFEHYDSTDNQTDKSISQVGISVVSHSWGLKQQKKYYNHRINDNFDYVKNREATMQGCKQKKQKKNRFFERQDCYTKTLFGNDVVNYNSHKKGKTTTYIVDTAAIWVWVWFCKILNLVTTSATGT